MAVKGRKIAGTAALAVLPEGWRRVKFGDVVREVKETVDPEASGLERYVAGEHMDTDDLHIRRWGTIGDGYLGPAFHRKFVKGQVLYGSRRTYLRKVAVAEFNGICANTTFVLEPKGDDLLPELLPFIMQTESFSTHAVKQSRGSVNPYVNFRDIAWYEFVLPPKEEQRRIADILWSADKTVVGYENVLSDMNKLRESLLLEYFHPAKKHEWQSEQITVAELVDRDVIAPPQDGNHGELHPKASDYSETGIPFIMANNIHNRTVDLTGCKFIPRQIADKLRIGFSYPGDVLLTHKGTVGEVAIVPETDTDYIMLTPQVTYYRILDKKTLDRDYLYFCFQSPSFQKQLMRAASQSTRDYIGILAQRKLQINLPPINIQKEIALTLENFDSELDRLQDHLNKCVKLKLASLLLLYPATFSHVQ